MSTQFNCQKHFFFKLFSLFKQLYITIQFSVGTVSMSKTVQFQTIQLSISIQFKCKYSLIMKTFLFQAIQFNQTIRFTISMPLVLFNPYIGPLSGATTPGQSGPGSDGNEGVLRIPQSSSNAGTSPSDCLVSYPGHSLGRSYPFAEKQSVYSTAPADWAIYWGRGYLQYLASSKVSLNIGKIHNE